MAWLNKDGTFIPRHHYSHSSGGPSRGCRCCFLMSAPRPTRWTTANSEHAHEGLRRTSRRPSQTVPKAFMPPARFLHTCGRAQDDASDEAALAAKGDSLQPAPCIAPVSELHGPTAEPPPNGNRRICPPLPTLYIHSKIRRGKKNAGKARITDVVSNSKAFARKNYRCR